MAAAFQGPPRTELPPPPVPLLPPLLPSVEQAPSAELPPVARTVPYQGEPTPPDGEPLFGLDNSGTPESANQKLRQVMALVVVVVALVVIIGRAVRVNHSPPAQSPMPWFPNMPAQGRPFPPGMATMPGGGPMGPIMPDEIREALEQPLIVTPEPPLLGPGRTVLCAIGGGQLQLGGLRYAVLPQLPADLRRLSPHAPQGPVVRLEMTARAMPPKSVPFTPADLRLKDDHGVWSSPIHAAWTGATPGNMLPAGALLGISAYFALGAGRSPMALGACRLVPGRPAGSPVVLAPFTAADRVSPPGAKPKRVLR